jgi:hypothetical protein
MRVVNSKELLVRKKEKIEEEAVVEEAAEENTEAVVIEAAEVSIEAVAIEAEEVNTEEAVVAEVKEEKVKNRENIDQEQVEVVQEKVENS